VLTLILSFQKLPTLLKSKALLLFLGGLNFFVYQKLYQKLNPKIEIIGANDKKGKFFMCMSNGYYNVLINTGRKTYRVRNFLLKHRVKKVNSLILTGGSLFEIEGVREIIEKFEVGEIILPGKMDKSRKSIDEIKKIRREKIPTKIIEENITGIKIKIGEITLVRIQKPLPTNFQYGAILLPYEMEFKITLKENYLTIE
jgi:hypothetical protein